LGEKSKARRPPWLAPALLAVFGIITSVAGNLIAADIQPKIKPCLPWVYVIFGLGVLATTVAAIVAARTSQETEAKPEPLSVQPSVISLHQLPPPPDDFTGRGAELDDLLDKVKEGGIAISGLQGTGGVGKTALALKLAEQSAPHYPDAQLYLDLKGVSQQPVTPAEAMARVIRAWHPEANLPESEAELSAPYRSALYGKRALLLLDNAADDKQVLPLLPPEGCLALVTSRHHFELPGCYTRSLDMLTPEDARDLVLKIAPRVGKQADDLARLCGYLPFSLEKAARTLASRKDLSAADYIERLGDAGAKVDLVEASLSLSYDLLSGEQQERWRMLGVFPGSFDAVGAAAVWEAEQRRAEDELGDLYLRSMVECETEGRYKLHDLSRVYADSKLSETERAAAQRRHAEHYARVACAADDLYEKGGESALAGLGLFDLERGNIEVGRRWASQHERDDDRAAELCVGYALGCIYVLLLRLHPRELIQWMNSALQSAQRLKNRPDEANSLGNMGNAYYLLGEYRRAIEFHEQRLAIAREIGDRQGEANALGNLGVAYYSLGEYRRAIEFLEQVLAIAREIGDRRGEAYALGNLGIAHKNLGEYRRAIEFYEQRLAIAREIGDRQGEANALWNMSLTLDKLVERAQAVACARAALDIYEQIEAPYAAKVRRQLAEWQAEE